MEREPVTDAELKDAKDRLEVIELTGVTTGNTRFMLRMLDDIIRLQDELEASRALVRHIDQRFEVLTKELGETRLGGDYPSGPEAVSKVFQLRDARHELMRARELYEAAGGAPAEPKPESEQ